MRPVATCGYAQGLPARRLGGLLGHDHKPPLDILGEARQQLARYTTIRLASARAEGISGGLDDFCHHRRWRAPRRAA